MQTIAVIGLGAMGMGIAQSLRRAGFTVHPCDVRVDVAKAYSADGGRAFATAGEAVIAVIPIPRST